MDYEALLVKYMSWVVALEGIDFLNSIPSDQFTEEEWAVLRALAKRAHEE